jgi:hypothetical protein
MAVQLCVIRGRPLPNSTYTDLVEASQGYVTLNGALPTIRDFSQCGFVDRAFRAILRDDCGPLDEAAAMFVAGSLLSAIGFALVLFYVCPCLACVPFGTCNVMPDVHLQLSSWCFITPLLCPCLLLHGSRC